MVRVLGKLMKFFVVTLVVSAGDKLGRELVKRYMPKKRKSRNTRRA